MPRAKHAEMGVARKLYIEDGLSPAQIAERCKVSESAVRGWARKGDWPKQREIMLGGPKSVHERLKGLLQKKLAELEEMNPEALTTSVLDGVQKLYKAVNDSADTMNIFEAAVLVAGEFVPFVRRRVPDEATRSTIFDIWGEFLEAVKD
jgi:hypothetical protein